jgi:RNA-directed DNA polymerase
MLSQGSDVPTRLTRITQRARQDRTATFDNLLSVLTVEFLADCFHALRHDAAPGVDAMTWEAYARELSTRLPDLRARIHRMGYHPSPVRRVHIDKGGGKTRPLGIPTVEDKLVQEALRRVLAAIFEGDFLPCSYGFRPGRGCHMALQALEQTLVHQPVNYVIDADIRGFFDHVDHARLLACVRTRVTDHRVLRYLMRFLKAGVWEAGVRVPATEEGVPQGGVLSPLLANIFLHYALDRWFQQYTATTLRGFADLNRYADDFVISVQHEAEAQQVLSAVQARLAHCGLTLAEDKTRLLLFSRFAEDRAARSTVPVGTFDYLGFTHYWGRNPRGKMILGHRTSRKKYRQKLQHLSAWLTTQRHLLPLPTLWALVQVKLRGHYAYYGIPGNSHGIQRFYAAVVRLLFRKLNRCSQRRRWTWAGFNRYGARFPLPCPRLVHHW